MSETLRAIREKEMVISEIEKKWGVPTSRAVKLFCDAYRVSRPNTDYLDQWSKQVIRRKRSSKPVEAQSSPSCGENCGDACDSDCGSCGSCGH